MTADFHITDVAGADAPQAFRQDGYVVVREFIDAELARFLCSYVQTRFASRLLGSGGPAVPDSLGGYGDPTFDGLLEFQRPKVEQLTGLGLHPTYSFFRLYRRGNELKRHSDRPACEVSVSLNVGQSCDAPWPLHLEGLSGLHAALLAPGDALIYRGVDLLHWREPFQGRECVQAFLHYVDRQGPYADRKFDGRETLMRPQGAG
jgi:hypothetical protein